MNSLYQGKTEMAELIGWTPGYPYIKVSTIIGLSRLPYTKSTLVAFIP